MRTITVTVSKTVQVKQYEPVHVTVTETVTCEDGDVDEVRLETYKGVTRSVHKFINNEVTKYSAEE